MLPLWIQVLWIAVGASLGALARHGVMQCCAYMQDVGHAVMVVNIMGCAFLACLLLFFERQFSGNHQFNLLVMTGFLSSFTTLSSVVLHTYRFMEREQWWLAFQYMLFHVGIPLLVLMIIMQVGHRLLKHG